MGGPCSTYGGRGGANTGFWWGNLRGKNLLEDSDVDCRIILRWIFRKWKLGARTGSRIGRGGGHV
jgi:hypothetical protein